MITLRDWYGSRSARERRLILLMLAIALPLLAWLLVVRPLSRTYDNALQRHLEAIDRHGRVQLLAEPDRASAQQATSVVGADIGLVVAEAATRAGLSLESNASTGPETATVSIAQAPATTVLQWLHGLESQGIRIEDVRIAPVGEGGASATARLSKATQ